MGYYSTLKNSTVCDILDKPWGHSAMWNKLATETQILHGSTYTVYLK